MDPEGRYAYTANATTNDVSQYTVGSDGSLTPMAAATVPAGKVPFWITVDPSGRYAYVTNRDSNDISQYAIGADGGLTPMVTATVASQSPVFVLVTGGRR
jgi:6-phosphogluconolactonase (cycloisomerase 2 family)